jgi:hypothetical protein
MNFTTFSKALWNLTTFDTIGYDKKIKQLNVYFTNGSTVEVYQVDEEDIFSFILTTDKDSFLEDYLLLKYDHKLKKVSAVC